MWFNSTWDVIKFLFGPKPKAPKPAKPEPKIPVEPQTPKGVEACVLCGARPEDQRMWRKLADAEREIALLEQYIRALEDENAALHFEKDGGGGTPQS
jgi:hypothetical protein